MPARSQTSIIFLTAAIAFTSSLSGPLLGLEWLPQALGKEKKDDVVLIEIAGRIIDEKKTPIKGAAVHIIDERGDTLESTQSDNNGTFSLMHKPCVACTLSVVPDEKSGLASALVEKIPGSVTRRFLLTLQKGFHVQGRVVHAGKGLKGLEVKAVASADDETQRSKVHLGGAAKTGRDGSFEMTLTPGPKILSVSNFRYDALSRRYEREVEITSDVKLDDLVLPRAH